jgi:hypothetical protein
MGLNERTPGKIKYQDVENIYLKRENSVQNCRENPKPELAFTG